MEHSPRCPLGHDGQKIPVETFGRFTMLRCAECTLEFCDPMEYSQDGYDTAYSEENGTEFYVPSVKWLTEANLECSEAPWMLFSAQIEALAELQAQRPGTAILDIGCGPGWFMMQAKRLGFRVMGAEVGSAPVRILRERGYDVVCGSLEAVPENWSPDVVTLFEVLEHLPDPVKFLSQIKSRFPKADFVLSVPSPKRWTKGGDHRDIADYPPNHLTRWNPASLALALSKAGYGNVEVRYSKPIQLEVAAVSLRTLMRSWADRMPASLAEVEGLASLRPLRREIAVRRLKYVPGILFSTAFRLLGWSGISMLAVARP